MDIIQELENLKTYVLTEPATVKGVVNRINQIENNILKTSKGNKSINIIALKTYIKSYASFGGKCPRSFFNGLCYYINLLDAEITSLKTFRNLSPSGQRFFKRLKADKK